MHSTTCCDRPQERRRPSCIHGAQVVVLCDTLLCVYHHHAAAAAANGYFCRFSSSCEVFALSCVVVFERPHETAICDTCSNVNDYQCRVTMPHDCFCTYQSSHCNDYNYLFASSFSKVKSASFPPCRQTITQVTASFVTRKHRIALLYKVVTIDATSTTGTQSSPWGQSTLSLFLSSDERSHRSKWCDCIHSLLTPGRRRQQ